MFETLDLVTSRRLMKAVTYTFYSFTVKSAYLSTKP